MLVWHPLLLSVNWQLGRLGGEFIDGLRDLEAVMKSVLRVLGSDDDVLLGLDRGLVVVLLVALMLFTL